MVHFFRRGSDTVSCETRLHPESAGFQLVVVQNGEVHVEDFDSLTALLGREREFLIAWKTHGWRPVDAPAAALTE